MAAIRQELPLVLLAARLYGDLARDGVAVRDMRRAPALELQFAGISEPPRVASASVFGVEPIEGPIAQRRVEPAPASETGLRYFLDGAQRTLPFVLAGAVPTAATVAAAGVVEREPCGTCELAPDTLGLKHVWIIPRGLNDPDLDTLLGRIDDLGMETIDPLALERGNGDDPDRDRFAAIRGDYAFLQQRVYEAARTVRERLERETLLRLGQSASFREGAGWIAVDGRLRLPHQRAIGIVKQFSESYLSGSDAATLLSLPPGCRTTAFVPTDRRRGGPAPEARTLWYLRLWDANGLDARHSLIRVEADQSVNTTEEIDRISSWLLAERTPRATGDVRWATLLYPVHQLERMLKRLIDGQTRGWAAR
ncbi:MAG: hypothetical protein IT337_10060 [Thermomicrobiales bacterium]|nr:hypothetical protein [Thermomicrobiales bacterium]